MKLFGRKTATYTTTDEWTGVVTVHAYTPLTRREAREAASLMSAPVAPITEEW